MESLDFSTVFAWRAAERLIAVLIGGGSIYLGYRLFMALPELSADGEGKFELPGGVSIYVSRVGPGIFFALFGTALVGLAFINVLTWQPAPAVSPAASPAVAATQVAQAPQEPAVFSYASGEIGPAQVSLERDTIVRDLRTLKKIEAALARHAEGQGFDLGPSDTTAALVALPRIKRLMLHGVWDEAWGDYQAFAAWVRDGALGPPPDGLSAVVVEAFRTGE